MSPQSPYAERLAAIPVTRATVQIDGSETSYRIYGDEDAPVTVVMVHGFRGDHHGLEPVIAHLAGYRVIAPDLPGFGESAPLAASAHSIEGYAGWLVRFVRELRVEGQVVLGHSFGSIVVSAAVSSGLRPSAVILVNPIAAPALSGPRGVFTRLAVFYYWLAARLPARLGFALLRNRLIVRIMSVTMAKTRDRGLRRWIHDQHDRYFSSFSSRDVVLEAFTASVSHDVSEYAATVTPPTLLVAADRDDITPVAAQHRLATQFADARLEVLPDVGHLIHYEMPEQAAIAIRRFLVERLA